MPAARGDDHWTRRHPERMQGDAHPRSKVDAPMRLRIHAQHQAGTSMKHIAIAEGVSAHVVKRVLTGRRWGKETTNA